MPHGETSLPFLLYLHSFPHDLMFYDLIHVYDSHLPGYATTPLEWLISISNSTCATLNSQSPPQPVSPIIIPIYVNSSCWGSNPWSISLKPYGDEKFWCCPPRPAWLYPIPLTASCLLSGHISLFAGPKYPRLSPAQDFGSSGFLCFQYEPSK